MRVEGTQAKPNVDVVSTALPKPLSKSLESTASGSTPDATGFSPTSDLVRLISAVRGSPDVRSELVADVTKRLDSGELGTPAATAQAAQNLFDLAKN